MGPHTQVNSILSKVICINVRYVDPAFRVCALPGSQPGATELKGETYLKNVYDFNVSERSLDIVVVLLFWIFFTVINYWLVEKIDRVTGMPTSSYIQLYFPILLRTQCLFIFRWIHDEGI
jgi:hypothetical protein